MVIKKFKQKKNIKLVNDLAKIVIHNLTIVRDSFAILCAQFKGYVDYLTPLKNRLPADKQYLIPRANDLLTKADTYIKELDDFVKKYTDYLKALPINPDHMYSYIKQLNKGGGCLYVSPISLYLYVMGWENMFP